MAARRKKRTETEFDRKLQPGGSLEKATKADARANRALKRLYAFEKAEFTKAGLDY